MLQLKEADFYGLPLLCLLALVKITSKYDIIVKVWQPHYYQNPTSRLLAMKCKLFLTREYGVKT